MVGCYYLLLAGKKVILVVSSDDVWVISGLNCLRRYQRSLVNPEKEELSQRRPVEAGQESSDGKVSIFVVFC